jgi:hypothetical protein
MTPEPATEEFRSAMRYFLAAALAVTVFLVFAGFKYFEHRRAQSLGFADAAERSAAEKNGFVDGDQWRKEKTAAEEAGKREAEEKTKREEAAAREAAAKQRAARIEAVRAVAQSKPSGVVKITSIGEARAAIDIWNGLTNLTSGVLNDNPTDAEIKLVDAARAKTRALKQSTFPRIRKAFERFAADKMWLDDYVVSVSGPRSQHITFKHQSFVLNRNVQAAHDAISWTLIDFRFKKVCFTSASVGECYEITSLKDDE